MAFDGSGNYVLSDTIAPATNADANELQAILTDIQNALNKCGVADGQSTWTGTLKGFDGTVALPMYTFSADLDSGFYRIGANNVGLTLGGTKRLDFGTAGTAITGTLDVSGAATFGGDTHVITSTDAGATVAPTLDLYRNSASPAVSDFLGSVDFNGKDSGAAKQLYAEIIAQITDPTAASEDAILILRAVVAGTLTDMLKSSATGITIPAALSVGTTLAIGGALSGVTTLSMGGAISGVTAPTVQKFTSGTAATYTPTSGTVRARVTMVGPGGGGGASATNSGSAGSANTSFQPSGGSAWTAVKGTGGSPGSAGTKGTGGTGGTDGTGTLIYRQDGQDGETGASTAPSMGGGCSPFFNGAPKQVWTTNAAGIAAKANSGCGGSSGSNGGGGGGGEGVMFWITAAQLNGSATYTVGAGGAGGSAGTNAGGAGAAGIIIIEEFYS